MSAHRAEVPDGHEKTLATVFDGEETDPTPDAASGLSGRHMARPLFVDEVSSPGEPEMIVEPVRVVSESKHGGRLTAAGTGLMLLLAAAVALSWLGLGQIFPWMTLSSHSREAAVEKAVAEKADVLIPGGQTPAETAISEVMSTVLSQFSAQGWSSGKPTDVYTGPALGFGCEAKDGLAPVASRTDSWSGPNGTGVTLTAAAYPAGAGGLVLSDLQASVLACAASSLQALEVPGLGAGSEQVRSPGASVVAWRRGDVVMYASFQQNGAPTVVAPYASSLTTIDAALNDALGPNVCVNQDDSIAAETRSPYIDAGHYAGFTETETVKRPNSAGEQTPRNIAASRGQKAYALPAAAKNLTTIPSIPVVPDPLPTSGPTALPHAVPTPVTPTAPESTAPDNAKVKRLVEDTVGPGCGWAFTGQAVPGFDAKKADAAFEKASRATQQKLTRTWKEWERSVLAYYGAYGAYLRSVKAYNAYAAKTNAVAIAWQSIETARDDYQTALGSWRQAVTDQANWIIDHRAAKKSYKAEAEECSAQENPNGIPSGSPTDEPSPSGSPIIVSDPSGSPSNEASQPSPTLVCPPVRPEILDETKPTVGPSPTPAAAAQLP